MNLQDYRKRKFKTIKAFAEAYQCGPSKASGILRGLYHLTLSKDEVKYLAHVLGISFIECADACDNTYAELKGYKGDDWKTGKRKYNGNLHKGIWARWQWQEDLQRDTKKAADSGDWTEYRKQYTQDWSKSWESQRGHSASGRGYIFEDCFTILGVSTTATPDQIKAAFRSKVKAASDGKGGFKGDMDKLVNAKEQALKAVKV